MAPRSGSAFIQDGRITRCSPSHRQPAFRVMWSRCFVVIVALSTLIVTNPSNGLGQLIPDRYRQISEKQASFWFSLIQPQDTNYGLFTLSRTIDGVSLTGLMRTTQLCQFDSPDQDELVDLLCGWIDDTFCHGKPLLDWNDLPYTVNRLLCWTLICIMIFPFFVERISPERIRKTSALYSIIHLSVLQQPTIWDVVRVNVIVYPTLVSMERLLRSYLVMDGYTWRFLLAFFLLFFVIGGIANQIGSMFQRQLLNGLGGPIAACLGYHRATGASRSIFQFVNHPFSASTIFWLDALLLFLQQQPGPLISWITGGFAGHIFGQLHQQWLAEALRSNIKTSVHRAIQQFLSFFVR